MLVIIALHRDIFNQYFIIIASIAVTNNSQTIIYKGQSINNGSTNHNSGSVTVVGIIQNRKSLLLEIWFSFRNNLAI